MARTFKSEEERQQALSELPEFPPQGEDVGDFNKRIDQERDEILSAEIVAEEAPKQEPSEEKSKAEEQPKQEDAVPQPQESSQPQPNEEEPKPEQPAEPQSTPAKEAPKLPELSEDDVIFTNADGKPILRKDLPEELQKYRTGGEVIKQFSHARNYANTAEERLRAIAAERDALRAKIAEADNNRKEREEQKPTPPPTPQPQQTAPQPAPQPQADDGDVDKLVEQLNQLNDDTLDPNTLSSFKSVVAGLAKSTKSAREQARAAQQVRSQFDEYRKNSDKELKELRSRWEMREKTEQEREQERRLKEAQQKAAQEIARLQEQQPELKTSKTCFTVPDNPTPTVEQDAWKFANRILLARSGRQAQNFADVAGVIDAWNKEDPELRAFCQNNGITPESVGTNDVDLLNMATCYNVYNAMRGSQFNPATGKLQQLLAPNGNPVNFPNARTAYLYLQDTNGITEARRRQELQTAEQRGQEAVLTAQERGTRQAQTIGTDGSASPDNIGQEMSQEVAEEILGVREGPRTIDEQVMQERARHGDRTQFSWLQRAQKRLGLPESQPDKDWPPAEQPQTVAQ